ncbi:hypothetical protein [Nocardioides litoris]|uniref:hypothetical protein n=1 Tax=Nocardioides litoris TaxID=1926648 RepID=UPI00111D7DFA|nr:hypothetical protein [Nocardioides litoris]
MTRTAPLRTVPTPGRAPRRRRPTGPAADRPARHPDLRAVALDDPATAPVAEPARVLFVTNAVRRPGGLRARADGQRPLLALLTP